MEVAAGIAVGAVGAAALLWHAVRLAYIRVAEWIISGAMD